MGEPTLLYIVVAMQITQFLCGAGISAYLVAQQRAVERELRVSSHPAIVARTLTDHGRRIELLEDRVMLAEAELRSAHKSELAIRETLFVLRGQADIMSRLLIAICNHLGIPIPRGVDLSGVAARKDT